MMHMDALVFYKLLSASLEIRCLKYSKCTCMLPYNVYHDFCNQLFYESLQSFSYKKKLNMQKMCWLLCTVYILSQKLRNTNFKSFRFASFWVM